MGRIPEPMVRFVRVPFGGRAIVAASKAPAKAFRAVLFKVISALMAVAGAEVLSSSST